MFRKILIATIFITATVYCFAADSGLPQVVTSEVFYDVEAAAEPQEYVSAEPIQEVPQEIVQVENAKVPTWPLAGSDADMKVDENCSQSDNDNVKIVSKIGSDIVVENNFNIGANDSWSGGANMLHGGQLPAGFYDDCNVNAGMPLLNREMLEDDGGYVLSASRSARRDCKGGAYKDTQNVQEDSASNSLDKNIAVNETAIEGDSAQVESQDQSRSWVVARGQTLRGVLQKWCDKEGWDLVWTTSREYPIEASAVFKGRFADVSSALVRNFSRAAPIPYAKFYKGNRVLVISTIEE